MSEDIDVEDCIVEEVPGISRALYSPCKQYRYWLIMRPGIGKGRIIWIMLNPSTATAFAPDPTVSRVMKRSVLWGYSHVGILNLFAYRSTDPQVLKGLDDPVGPRNDEIIVKATESADTVVAAWGVYGALHGGRDLHVRGLLRGLRLDCLGTTAHGHPRHPLYVSYAQGLETFQE